MMKHNISITIFIIIISSVLTPCVFADTDTLRSNEEYAFYSLLNYGSALSTGIGYYSDHQLEVSATGFIMGYHSDKLGLQVDTYVASISVPVVDRSEAFALGDVFPLRIRYSPFNNESRLFPYLFGEFHYFRFEIKKNDSGEPRYRPDGISLQGGVGFNLNIIQDSTYLPLEVKIGYAQKMGFFVDVQLLFGGYRSPKTHRN